MADRLAKTALIIPVHNRRATTLQGLRSLRRINTSGLEVKIIVVDDGSSDGTSEAIRNEFPEVDLIAGDGSLHYAAGTNRGIEAAIAWQADYVVTMNDDSIFHEDFLLRLIETSSRFERSIVGSLLLLWDDPHLVFQVDPKWKPFQGGWVFPQDLTAFSVPAEPFEVQCLVGNCLLLPMRAIEENGPLDEVNFPFGWGDAQLAMRMRKAGWRLLVDPRSRVWCEPNTYPKPLHTLKMSDRLSILLKDRRHPANLQRQFKALWHSAPSRFSALVAFASYVGGLFLKALRLRSFGRKV